MKKFFENLGGVAMGTCIAFTISVALYAAIDIATSRAAGEPPAGLPYPRLWQMLGLCAVISALQFTVFSGKVVKRARYSLRVAVFFPVLLGILCLFAWGFRWFPVEEPAAWGIFFGSFCGLFLLITGVFEVWLRLAGRKYDTLLGRYRAERSKKE